MYEKRHRNLTVPFMAVGAGFIAAALVSIPTAGIPTALGMGLGAATMFFFAYMEKRTRERERLLRGTEETVTDSERDGAEEEAPETSSSGGSTDLAPEAAPNTLFAQQRERALAKSTASASQRSEIQRLKYEAEAALRSGDMDAAQQSYRSLLLLPLASPSPISEAEVLYGLGVVYERRGDTRKAIAFLERAAASDARESSSKSIEVAVDPVGS